MTADLRILGIDIGSVTISISVIDQRGRLLYSDYQFHRGDIQQNLEKMLSKTREFSINYSVATSSTPDCLEVQKAYDSQISLITAAKSFHPDMHALLHVGGEKFSLTTFDAEGHYLGSVTNTSCAAGTGSFLDQQAERLKLSGADELGRIAENCTGNCPQVATRCAVFAKTDIIHAQQEGYSLDEVSNGLCRGLAKNIIDTLFSSSVNLSGELVFCGGVGKNEAVVHHLEELLELSFIVPEAGHIYGSYGAALLFIEDLEQGIIAADTQTRFSPDSMYIAQNETQREYFYPPLELKLSHYPDFSSKESYLSTWDRMAELPVEVDIYEDLEKRERLDVYLGIDIGSTSTKAVLLDGKNLVIAGFYTRTAGRPLSAVQNIFFSISEICKRKNVHFTILQAGTTGSGRKFIGKLIGADTIVDEITAHARAAYQLDPEVDTILEIGGQDAKFTTLSNGRVTSSIMNNVCAAGTGSFIEEQAGKLGCSAQEYSARTEGVRAPMTSDRCTVFMERDMNHFLSRGYSVEEVLASALHSVRENYLVKVASEKSIGKKIFFQGATAKNKALVAAFEQKLGKEIIVSKFCHLTGALGVALLLKDEQKKNTTFGGVDLHEKDIPIMSEICDICTNHCKINVATVNGQQVAYGFLCGRDYETKSYKKIEDQGFDLLRERRKLAKFDKRTKHSDIIIGIPWALHLVEDMYLWKRFFDLLDISVITSESFQDGVKVGKLFSQAEFCSPITAMQGHVDYIQDKCDFVFMPVYLENKAKDARRQYCYYTQYISPLTDWSRNDDGEKVLRPVIKYLYTAFHTKMQLYRMLQKISPQRWSFIEVANSYDRALLYDQEYRKNLQLLYEKRNGVGKDIEVVFLGRPYSLLSAEMNGKIPHIFKKLGVDCFYQDMIPYDENDVQTIEPLLKEIHWKHGSKIVEVAEVTAKKKNSYPVFVTSFQCSPDSFVTEYIRTIMEQHNKPYLILELDELDSSVGYETRIEAAIRSFRNHREEQQRAQCKPPHQQSAVIHPLNPSFVDSMEGKHVLLPNWDDITGRLIVAALEREGFTCSLLEESDQIIRESLKHNSGQCIPLNVVAQGAMSFIQKYRLNPADCVLWLNKSTLACNIKLYPHQIGRICHDYGSMGELAIYKGNLSFSDVSIRCSKNAYFCYLFGGMLRKVACKIRPFEKNRGETDRVLEKSIEILSTAFRGKRSLEKTLDEVISRFEWIDIEKSIRPKVAIFGDLYSRDNRVMNQNLIRFIEDHGGEVITTPYSEYGKMIAGSYFRKWFKEGNYLDVLTFKTLLTAMSALERTYTKMFNRILEEEEHVYSDDPAEILAPYQIAPENTGESMDNLLKIHYLKKHYPDLSLMVQASPALCCASLITEAMRTKIETHTGIPVVSITYDGTGGSKNDALLPYLKFPRKKERENGFIQKYAG